MIHSIFFDIDGTLVSFQTHEIPASTIQALAQANEDFNRTVDLLEKKAASGEVFLIAPSEPVTVKRFDGDMEKLGHLYWLGYRDMERQFGSLMQYLGQAGRGETAAGQL